jgi:hypothetical protein
MVSENSDYYVLLPLITKVLGKRAERLSRGSFLNQVEPDHTRSDGHRLWLNFEDTDTSVTLEFSAEGALIAIEVQEECG